MSGAGVGAARTRGAVQTPSALSTAAFHISRQFYHFVQASGGGVGGALQKVRGRRVRVPSPLYHLISSTMGEKQVPVAIKLKTLEIILG